MVAVSQVSVDPGPLTPEVGYRSFHWASHAGRLDIAVVGGEEDSEAMIQKPVHEVGEEAALGPLADLVTSLDLGGVCMK